MADTRITDSHTTPTPNPITPPFTTITASGNSNPIEARAGQNLRMQLNVTAASGTTPSLIVTVQDSVDNGATWNNLAPAFTAASAPGKQVINIPAPFGYLVRLNYTVSGTTPSFTFGIDGITR